MKRKPTTKKHFRDFVKEFKRLQAKLGLTEWKVCFYHEPVEGAIAMMSPDNSGMRVDIWFNDSLLESDHKVLDVKATARHECLHLLLAPLYYVASCRWAQGNELEQAEEKLIRRLEKVVI